MNILYCGDSNIADGLIISVLSLLKNTKEELNIYVFTMDLKLDDKEYKQVPASTIKMLDKKVKETNKNNFIKKILIDNLFNEQLPEANINTLFTPYSMLRIYADQVKEMPDKILYLDYDVVCRKDIKEFYNQDITNYEVVGVLDYYGKWFFKKNPLKFDYINSGVLLLNLKKIKETELFEKCRQMCKQKRMLMPDQSSINKLSTFKKIIEEKYNEQHELKEDTVLQHFSTSFKLWPWIHTVTIKPWDIEKVHNELNIFEYDDILEQYEELNKEIKGELVYE